MLMNSNICIALFCFFCELPHLMEQIQKGGEMFKSSRVARIHHLLFWGYDLTIGGSTKENKKKSGADQSECKINKKKTGGM